jgi:hypothetical protein
MLGITGDDAWKWAAAAAASAYVVDTVLFSWRVSADRDEKRMDAIVAEACEHVYTNYVRGARRDGRWDEAAKKQAMSSALSYIKQTTGARYSDPALAALVASYLRQARRAQPGAVPAKSQVPAIP